MKRRAIQLECKGFDDGEGIVEGYATTFGFPADLDGDIIHKNAFDNSLDKINLRGIPLLDGHGKDSVSKVIGTIFSAKKTSHGILIRAKLADTESTKDIYKKLQQGHINKFSIGMMIESVDYVEKDKQEYRQILKAELLEVSLVAIPANPQAEVLAVKEAKIEAQPEVEATAEAQVEPVAETQEATTEATEVETQVEAEVQSVEEAQEESVKIEDNDSLQALRLRADLLEEQVEITRRKLGHE